LEQKQQQQELWLSLLEQHNYCLEEIVVLDVLDLSATSTYCRMDGDHERDSFDDDEEDHHEDRRTAQQSLMHNKMHFYVQLNRQPILLPDHRRRSTGGEIYKLRSLLRHSIATTTTASTMIKMVDADELLLPCLEAALQIPDPPSNLNKHNNHSSNHLDNNPLHHSSFHMGPSTSFLTLSFDSDDDDDDDDYLHNGRRSLRHYYHPNISALFYLLSQQPSLVQTIQDRWDQYDRQNHQEQDHLDTTTPADDCNSSSENSDDCSSSSPQLLLLDDDIVALW